MSMFWFQGQIRRDKKKISEPHLDKELKFFLNSKDNDLHVNILKSDNSIWIHHYKGPWIRIGADGTIQIGEPAA